jgi:hypothetical protein
VNFLRRLALQEKKLDDSARLDVVQMCDIVQGCWKVLSPTRKGTSQCSVRMA